MRLINSPVVVDPINEFLRANDMFSRGDIIRVSYLRDDLDEVFIVQLGINNYVHCVFNAGNLVKIYATENLNSFPIYPTDCDEFISRKF